MSGSPRSRPKARAFFTVLMASVVLIVVCAIGAFAHTTSGSPTETCSGFSWNVKDFPQGSQLFHVQVTQKVGAHTTTSPTVDLTTTIAADGTGTVSATWSQFAGINPALGGTISGSLNWVADAPGSATLPDFDASSCVPTSTTLATTTTTTPTTNIDGVVRVKLNCDAPEVYGDGSTTPIAATNLVVMVNGVKATVTQTGLTFSYNAPYLGQAVIMVNVTGDNLNVVPETVKPGASCPPVTTTTTEVPTTTSTTLAPTTTTTTEVPTTTTLPSSTTTTTEVPTTTTLPSSTTTTAPPTTTVKPTTTTAKPPVNHPTTTASSGPPAATSPGVAPPATPVPGNPTFTG